MDPFRQLCLALLVATLIYRPTLADSPSVEKFDADRFNALSREQKVGYVLSVLDARDRKLSNFRYVLRESCTNINKQTGARRFMVRCEYEVRRLGPRLWMHLTNQKYWSDTHDVDSEGFVNWDGKTAVNLVTPETARGTHHTASVHDTPNTNFWLKKYNELLGLRVQVFEEGVPIAEFVRSASRRGDPIVVQAERRQTDHTEIKVEVRRGDDQWLIWLDPSHDHMISRFEYRYDHESAHSARQTEVLVPFQVNGVWVPKEAVHVTETSAYEERSEFKYSVTTFEIGSVAPADVEIRFPVGTEVSDMINQVVYTVLPDGRRRMEPLAQIDKKTLRVPPKEAVTALPPAEAAKLYTAEPLVLVKPPPKVSHKLRAWVISLNAVVVIAAVVYYVRRKRRLSPSAA